MCGLAGFGQSDARAPVDLDAAAAMARALAHRGPDDQTVQAFGPFALAFRRLSIIDLAGGRQPLSNETGDVVVVCNGEIYNHAELRAGLAARGHRLRTQSDVEVIAHLYEERGAELVHELVGMFAFALVDLRGPQPTLLLGRDRFGIKPLYWAEDERGIAFASEPKALLARGGHARDLRAEALLDYLVQGYVGGDESAWVGIHRLLPASTLSWTPGRAASVRRYWDLPLDGPREPAPREEILEWLDRAVRDHMIAEVPLGAFLSGGIDSNAVADSMARASAAPIATCSIGFREASHDELPRARASAARLGARHHERVLTADPRLALDTLPWFFDEPHADPSAVPTYLVSQVAREVVTVALSGDGGDEVFAGYRRYVHDWAENRLRARLGARGARLVGAVGRSWPHLARAPRWMRGRTFLSNVGDDPARAYWRSVTQVERSDALALLAPELAARLSTHDPFEAFAEHHRRPRRADALYRAQYADFHTYLPDQILAKVDRASMAVSLEVRPPLLDHRFAERFAHLPASEKVRGARGKHALREALRGRLPAAVLDGPKRGFDVPLASWVRGPLAGAVTDAIESLPERWFSRARLRERWDEHHSGARDHARLLWSLLVLEHWRRRHGVRGLSA